MENFRRKGVKERISWMGLQRLYETDSLLSECYGTNLLSQLGRGLEVPQAEFARFL